MHKPLIAVGFLISMAIPAASALAQAPMAFKSVSVELPESEEMFPGGPEADAINNSCLACHSSEMVLNQPPLPRATWEAEVKKMISAYKAPVDPADVANIVDYLAKTKGKD
jgi:cytochrome c553